MAQLGLFDTEKRLAARSAKVIRSKRLIDWCRGRDFAPTSRRWC